MNDIIKSKARELAIAYFGETNEQGKRVYDARCEAACQEMAKWMKEQMIDKACEWLENVINNGAWIANDVREREKAAIIAQFKEDMEDKK